jgi:ketosteroid isomerase-like protein
MPARYPSGPHRFAGPSVALAGDDAFGHLVQVCPDDIGLFAGRVEDHVGASHKGGRAARAHGSGLADRLAAGLESEVIEVVPGGESVLVGLRVSRPEADGSRRVSTVHQVMRLHNGLIADILGYPSREAAAAQAGINAR